MNFLRNTWFYIGGVIACALIIFLFIYGGMLSFFQLILWLNLITLLIHQFEEYVSPGYFPGMINRVMFSSKQPDRYPLNTNTALIVNVFLGWTLYFIAAVFAEKAVWLAIAAILVSCGNIIAHTFLFNIKGKTFYNPGMISSIVLFLPMSVYFFIFITQNHLASLTDYLIGIPLGIIINYVGVIKLIDILKDKNTNFVFSKRFIRNNK